MLLFIPIQKHCLKIASTEKRQRTKSKTIKSIRAATEKKTYYKNKFHFYFIIFHTNIHEKKHICDRT